ncbi:hypothetical protein ACF0H5_006655 [Mactra antiquata]
MVYLKIVPVFVGLYFLAHVYGHPARPSLPLCEKTIKNKNEHELWCLVADGQHLNYDEIRTYTKPLPKNVKVNVTINCINDGIIRLPWPLYASNVVSLHVSGCINEGLLSERTVNHGQRNELRQVVFENIRHRVTISELHDSIVNLQNMSTDYACGPSNTVVQIYKNIQYLFPKSSGSLNDLILLEELMSESTVDRLTQPQTICRYPHLRLLENSGSRSFSNFHLKTMETNQYPKLRQYSLWNNSLPRLPAEIASLQIDFLPSLTYLDLSRNELTSADFDLRGKLVKHKLLINLQNNMIRELNSRVVTDIAKTKGVILDLRNNDQLQCSCDLFSYGDYLISLKSNSARAVYKGITCEHNEQGTIISHSLHDIAFRNELCKPTN